MKTFLRSLPILTEDSYRATKWREPGRILIIDEEFTDVEYLFQRGFLGERTPYTGLRDISWRKGFRKEHGLTERALRRSPEHQNWLRVVRDRQGRFCASCGTTARVEAHHIYPLDYLFELAFDPDNGMMLCHSCHRHLHGYADHPTYIVGWELPRLISKLSIGVRPCKMGFSFKLWEDEDRPEIRVSQYGRGFRIYPESIIYPGYRRPVMIDLWTIAFAQTGRKLTYEQALNEYGVDTLQGLTDAMLIEHKAHPVSLQLSRVFSNASYAKSYLRAMDYKPPLNQYHGDKDNLEAAMNAYYGARAEVSIRKVNTPCTYVDFRSEFAAVNVLMRLERYATANSIVPVDATSEAQEILDHITLDRCFSKRRFSRMNVFCQIIPDGDFLPMRDKPEDSDKDRISMVHLTSPHKFWYALPDLVYSKLITGKAPKILKAVRFEAYGRSSVKSVRLCGDIKAKPNELFRTIVESRSQYPETHRYNRFLKTLASSGSYGIGAEILRTGDKEVAGHWFFPPWAAMVTAGGRLLLGMLELCVREAGGECAYFDTDAAMITGLSWEKVDEIRERFNAINPYRGVGDFLKLEKENFVDGKREQLYVYAVASKLYALFNWDGDKVRLRKTSKHTVSIYDIPTERVDEAWECFILNAAGKTVELPEWSTEPVQRLAAFNSPTQSFWGQAKPFHLVHIQDKSMGADMMHMSVLRAMNTRVESSMEATGPHYRGKLQYRTVTADELPVLIGKEGTEKKPIQYQSCRECGTRIEGMRADALYHPRCRERIRKRNKRGRSMCHG